MHLWSIKLLAFDLADGAVDAMSGMRYFLATVIITIIQHQSYAWGGPVVGWQLGFESLVLLIINIFGCLQCWSVTRNDAFVFNVVCLSVPAGVRVMLYSSLLWVGMYFYGDDILYSTAFKDPNWAWLVITYVIFTSLTVYYWYLIYKGFCQIEARRRVEGRG